MLLGRRFPMRENVTRLHNSAWIDGDVSFVDVANDAFFIDQEGGAIAKTLLLIENAIIFYDGALEIAEDREGNSELFGEFAVCGNTVNTHSENLSVR